jgi:hypothetical protein
MDTKSILVKYTPEDLEPLLEKAAEKNEGDLLHLISDLLYLNRQVFVSLETAQAFQALSNQ